MKPEHPDDYQIDDSFEKNVSSAMEMTGLIPALPEDEAEIQFYNELFPYLPEPADEKKTDRPDGQTIG